MDGAIDLNWRIITGNIAKEEVATSLTASVRGTDVRDIGVHIEHHVTSRILYFCIGMSGHVVEELVYVVVCVFSRSSLLARDSRECCEDSGINSMCIVEEASNNLLDELIVVVVEFGACVDWVNSLIVLPYLIGFGL